MCNNEGLCIFPISDELSVVSYLKSRNISNICIYCPNFIFSACVLSTFFPDLIALLVASLVNDLQTMVLCLEICFLKGSITAMRKPQGFHFSLSRSLLLLQCSGQRNNRRTHNRAFLFT